MKYTPEEIAALLANRPNQPHYVKDLIGKCIKAAVLAEREACAITAWSAGMDEHNAARGLPCDARDVGSKAAAAIRARGTP